MRRYLAYFILVLLTVTFVGIAVFVSFDMARSIYFGEASRTWPTTQATITRSEARTSGGGRRGLGGGSTSAKIEYEYSVSGLRYEGRRVSYLENYFDNDQNDIVWVHREGTRTTVYYQGRNPERSTLTAGVQYGKVALGVFMILAFGGMGILTGSMWRHI